MRKAGRRQHSAVIRLNDDLQKRRGGVEMYETYKIIIDVAFVVLAVVCVAVGIIKKKKKDDDK